MTNSPSDTDLGAWRSEYRKLAVYSRRRRRELSSMFEPYVQVTDDYSVLLCGIVTVLGRVPSQTKSDGVFRDLLADVFDALYESRRLILESKLMMAYPLVRRAYESHSLLLACYLDPTVAKQWSNGKQIPNRMIREVLDSHSLGESTESTRELYAFLSEAAHPNRGFVPERFLGDGNQFVLGAIGVPSLAHITDYCGKHLSLWFWFAATVAVVYRETLGREIVGHYVETAKHAKVTQEWLGQQLTRLLNEEQPNACD